MAYYIKNKIENKRTHRKQDDKYFDKLAKRKLQEESNGIVEIDGIYSH